ncbi:MAG: ATP synthase F1 subunit delta [Clostridiales bacterium]|nr:ATP synthase F1 subunit delta [Clostridiales bacterium]
MNGGGREYAIALFEIMLENDHPEVISSDLDLVYKTINENPDYIEYLINPSVPKSERVQSINEAFEDQVCEPVFSFLNVIMQHRDMHVLLSAIDEFRTMYEDYKNLADAVITSAVELSEDQKSRLIDKLTKVTGKKIKATYTVDRSLLGGITVTVDGMHFDGSVLKNLKNIKEVIS